MTRNGAVGVGQWVGNGGVAVGGAVGRGSGCGRRSGGGTVGGAMGWWLCDGNAYYTKQH